MKKTPHIDNTDGLIKHGTIMLVATVLTGVSNLLFNLVMSRMLTREQYGDLGGLLAVYMIINLPLLAIQIVTARYVSELNALGEQGKASALLRRSLVKLSLIGAFTLIAFLAVGPLLASYLNVESLWGVYAVGLACSLAIVTPVFWGALQGNQFFLSFAGNQIFSTLAKLVGGVLLVVAGLGVAGAVSSLVLFHISIALLAFFQLRIIIFGLRGGEEGVDSRPHYRFFWPVVVSLLSFAVFTQVDTLMVKHFFNRDAAGEYVFAQVIGKAFLFGPIALAAAMFPKVSKKTAAGELGAFRLLNLTLIYCISFCLLGVVFCGVLADTIRQILFPRGGEVAAGLIRIFGLGITPFALVYILINYLQARGRTSVLYALVPLAALYALTLQLYHKSLPTIILIMAVYGAISFTYLYLVIYFIEKKHGGVIPNTEPVPTTV